MMNIKIQSSITNKTWWPLVDNSIEIAKQCGFEYVGYRTLKNIKRAYGTRGLTEKTKTKVMNPNADEKILIFKKRNPQDSSLSIFFILKKYLNSL